MHTFNLNKFNNHFESKGEYGHDDLEDESQAELPHGGVDAGSSIVSRHLASVLAELGSLERAAVSEQFLYQLTGVLPRVRVWESNHSSDGRHQDHLQYRVLA